jgi:hypothetical protein
MTVKAMDAAVTPGGTWVSSRVKLTSVLKLIKHCNCIMFSWPSMLRGPSSSLGVSGVDILMPGLCVDTSIAKQKEIALGNILALTGTVLAMTVKMHGLRTDFSTTWFLAPYCAWLGYGEFCRATLSAATSATSRESLG